MLIHLSAITNKIEHENYANANLTTAFCNMQCDESTFNNIERIEKENSVWPIRRSKDPIVEWNKNNEIVAGAFPFLFLRGHKMLPEGSFNQKLIRHLFLHYNGRFEKCNTFINLLFNQLQRHSAIRKIARVETLSRKAIKKLEKLI